MEPLGDAIGRVRSKMIARGVLPDSTLPDPNPEPPVAVDGGPWCDRCQGKRLLRLDLDRQDPDFGKTVRCPDCHDLVQQQRFERLWGSIPSKYQQVALSTFPGDGGQLTDDQRKLVTRLQTWPTATLFSGDPAWLYLWGRSGRGKTGLAISVLRICMEQHGMSGIFKVVPDMLDKIRDTYRDVDALNSDNAGVALLQSLRDCDVLLLDDIGTEKATDWAVAKLFQIIGHRHDHRKRTIFTSNLDLEELAEHFDHARIPSRIQEMTDDEMWVIEVKGENLRKKVVAF